MSQDGSIAVVAGAGSGIGRAVAVALLEAGYRVTLAGRREQTLWATLAGHEPRGLVAPTDVTEEVSVRALFERVRAEFGRHMKEQRPQGGRIINNGSVSAQVPRPHAAAYRGWTCATSPTPSSTWLGCRWTRTSSS